MSVTQVLDPRSPATRRTNPLGWVWQRLLKEALCEASKTVSLRVEARMLNVNQRACGSKWRAND